MLCRTCGVGEREHYGFDHPFVRSKSTTPLPHFLTGMSIAQDNNLPKPTSNPKYHAALKELAELHDKKSLDYADTSNGNWYTNFEEAAATAGIDVEEVFMALIGVKLARLRELKKKGLTPQNESVQDSRKDLANYSILMYSYFID